MKKVYTSIVLLLLVSGCQTDEATVSASKPVASDTIYPIEGVGDHQLEIIGWYDEQSLIYLLSEENSFNLFSHDVLTGEDELFYTGVESEQFHRLDVNKDQSLFALQTLNDQGQAELVILNKSGDVEIDPDLSADDYSIYWSPYHSTEFMAVAFQPDWKQEVYHVDLEEMNVEKTGIQSNFIQWSTENTVTYLNWSMIPSIEAPLQQYDLTKNQTKDGIGSALYFSNLFQDRSLLVKYKEIQADEILYEFTDGIHTLGSVTIPILNTFSEHWWITSYAFDGVLDRFYYLSPRYTADYVTYKDSFDLFMYDLNEDSNIKLGQLDQQEPLELSSDGKWLLAGSVKKKLISTEDGTVFKLY
ncbi:hypothetical protein MKX54_07925 [Alkalihalobacillus sp. FSL R5-0424]